MLTNLAKKHRILRRHLKWILVVLIALSIVLVVQLNANAVATLDKSVTAPRSVVAQPGPRSVTLKWQAPESINGRAVSGYQIEWSTTGLENSWSTTSVALASLNLSGGEYSYVISNLSASQNYYTRVAALLSSNSYVGAYGYQWTLAYKTTTTTRNGSGQISYTSTPASPSSTNFSRVRYRLQAGSTFADVDFFKTFSGSVAGSETYSSISMLRVPSVPDPFELHAHVSDLTINSNASIGDTAGESGGLEIWPWNYGTARSLGSQGSDGTYDVNDTNNADGNYGSFQVHNLTNTSTVFAWNNHSNTPDIGFGSNTGNTHTDWTFMGNGGAYVSSFIWESYANMPVTTPASSLQSNVTIQFGPLNEKFTVAPTIQLKGGTSNDVTSGVSVVASIVSGTGTLISGSATAVTDSTGLATFSNLGLASGTIGSNITIRFTATGYGSVDSNSIPVVGIPTSINVSNTGTESSVYWYNNVYYSGTAAAIIRPTSLTARLNAGLDAVLRASSSTITVTNGFATTGSTAGNLTLEANTSALINDSLTLTGASRSLTVKAATDILVSSNITTAAGAVTLWSDTNASGGGGIKTALGTSIQTNGGNLMLSGGLDSTSGFAKGTLDTNEAGVSIAGSISSGSGSITIRGEEAASPTSTKYGILLLAGANVSSTSGVINLHGKVDAASSNTSNNHYGVWLGDNSATPATVNSTLGAINILGDATPNANTGRWGVILYSASITSTDGAITIEGRANSNSVDVRFLKESGSTNTVSSTNSTVTVKGSASSSSNFEGTSTFSAGSTLTFQLNNPRFNTYTSTVTLGGAGAKVIEPPVGNNSFGSSQTFSNLSVSNTSSGLRIGRSTNTANVTLTSSSSVAGPIQVYGGLITQSVAMTTTTATGTVTYQATAGIDLSGGISSSAGISLTSTGATSDIINKAGSNLAVSGQGGTIFMKSARNVDLGAKGMTYTTNKGDIVLWADSDGDTDTTNGGSVWVGGTSVLNTINGDVTRTSTGGGSIIIGGGTAGTTRPTGYLSFRANGTGVCGFESGTNASTTETTKYYTGGGDFRVKVKGYLATDSVCFTGATTLWANGGQIDVDQQTSTGNGLQIARGNPSAVSDFFSSSNTVPAIKFSAQTNNSFGFLIGHNNAGPNQNYIQATGDGGISISGVAVTPSTTWPEVGIGATNILSKGPITIDTSSNTSSAGGLQIAKTGNAGTGAIQNIFGYCALVTCPDSQVTSGSPTITINSNVIERIAARHYATFNTAGTVTIQPKATTGFAQFNNGGTGDITISADCTGLTIGKDQTTDTSGEIAFYDSWTIAGPIRIYGQNINQWGSLATTAAGSEIRVKLSGRFYLDSGESLNTNRGDVVIWTGSAKASGTNLVGTNIYLQDATSITTKGGKIWLAGGRDDGGADAGITAAKGKWSDAIPNDGYPDGYATGYNLGNEWAIGVFLNINVTLKSGGGDIFIAGAQGPASTVFYGSIIIDYGAKIDSGNGRINMIGSALPGTNVGSQGLALNYNGDVNGVAYGQTMITSNATTSDAINIYSDQSNNIAANVRGLTAYWHGQNSSTKGWQGTQILATANGGGITMTGIGGQSSTTEGYGVWTEFVDVLAKSGPITINAVSNPNNTATLGLTEGTRNNGSNLLRLGAWKVNGSAASGGATITTPSNLVADFSTSSSDITINADSFYNLETSNVGHGINFNTTGDVLIRPARLTNGLVANTTDFKRALNADNYRLGNIGFGGLTPASFTFGVSGTSTNLSIPKPMGTVAGSISIYGGAIDGTSSLTTSNSGNISITATGAYTASSNLDAAGNLTVTSASFAGTGTTSAGGTNGTSITATNGDVALSNTNTVSAQDARFLAKASVNVSTSSASSIRTNSGKIVLWSDSDNSAGGTVTVKAQLCTAPISVVTCSSTVGAGGDDIVIGGAAASSTDANLPGGYASGTAMTTMFTSTGVQLGTLGASNASGPKIYSYGGNVQIAGQTASGSATDYTYGVNLMVATEIHTSLGKISILGKNNASVSTKTPLGVELNGWGNGSFIKLVSTNTDDDSIRIKALSTNSTDLMGFNATNSGSEITTSGGAIIQSNHIASDAKIKWAVSGTIVLEPVDASFSAALDFDADSSFTTNAGGLRLGKVGNSANVTFSSAKTVAGAVTIYAGTATVSAGLTATNSDVSIVADQVAVTAAINSGTGMVSVTPATAAKPIALGAADSGSQLGLTETEFDFITAGKIRVGDGSNSGNVTVTGAIQPNNSSTLAIRTGGGVSGSGTIAIANLGISAATVNLGGSNSVTGNLALDTASVAPTFTNSTTYTPAEVDGIAAEFGTPTQIVANLVSPATQDAFMNVVFNPPPSVTFKDKFGNTLAANNSLGDTLTATASKASGSGTLAGTQTATAVDGVATFSDLKITTATGNHTLSFSAQSGALTATSGTYNVKAGEPASLAVTMAQTTISAGKTFGSTTRPVVTLKDSGNNTVISGTHATATVTATITGTDGQIVAGATKAAVAGEATFDLLALAGKVGGTYSIRYSVTYTNTSGVVTTVNSTDTPITFTHGDATLLEVTTPASHATNGVVFTTQPKITIKDAYDNVVTSSNTTITISETNADIALAGTVSMPAVAGVADFSLNTPKTQLNGKKATGYTLTYTATSPSLTNTQPINLTYGAATKVVKTTPAAGFENDVAFTTQPILEIQDQSGNRVENSNATVTIASSGGSPGTTLGGTISMEAQAGVANFQNKGIKLTGLVNTYTLTYASDNLTSDTQTAVLTNGAAKKLAVATQAAGAKNRKAFDTQPVIEVQDVSGNPVPNSGLIIRAAATGVTLSGSTDISASPSTGRAVFTNLMFTGTADSTGYQIAFTATTGSITGTAQTVPLAAGDAYKLAVTPTAYSATNDVVFGTSPTVTLQDQEGNLVTGAPLTVKVTITGPGNSPTGFGNQSISGGTITFPAAKLTGFAGSYTVTYGSVNDNLVVATQTVTLAAGAPTKLRIVNQAAGFTNRAVFSTQPKVEILDVSSNRVLTSTAEVTVAMSNGTLDGTKTVAANAGLATFTDLYKYGLVGTTKQLTFTSSGLTEIKQPAFALTPGAVTQIVATTEAAGFNNGVAFTTQPVIKIQDQDGNTVTGSTAEVTVTSTGTATLGGTTKMYAVAGVADFFDKGLKLTGTQGANTLKYEIADPAPYYDEQVVTLAPGAATQLALTTPADGFINRTDFSAQPIVEVRDASGNKVADSNAVITVAISNATLTGTTTATASSGVATFTGLGKYGLVGSKRLTFSSGSLIAVTQDFVLTYGAATKVKATTPAAGFTNDVAFTTQPTVKVQDQDGNTVDNFAGEIRVTTAFGTLTGTNTISTTNGVVNFSGLKLNGDTDDAHKLTYSAVGTSLTTDFQDFTLSAGAADHFEIIAAPTAAQNRIDFASVDQPVIEVRDVNNNPVPNSGITVAISTTSLTLDGTTTATADAITGRATFSGLSLRGTINGKPTLRFADSNTGGLETVTREVTVTHGVSTKLSVLPTALTEVNGTTFATTPVVTIEDADSNIVKDSTLTVAAAVTAKVGTTQATSTTGFANQTLGASGQLSYPTAKITGKAQDYLVTYSAGNLDDAVLTVTIGHAAASQLVKVAMPASAQAGIDLGAGVNPSPKFEIQDASGNLVTTGTFATASVSATVTQITGNREQTTLRTLGADASSVTAQASGGVVEFTDIALAGDAGDTYDIAFAITAPSNSIAANTQQVTLAAGAPHKLAVTTQPRNVVAGVAFSPAPQVQIQDAWNNPVGSVATSYAIKADLVTTDAATVEDNTQSAVTVSGAHDTATFSSVTFSAKGNHKLRFTATGLVAAVSGQFEIASAPAHHLLWENQGSSTVKNGYVVATAPKLKIVDEFDNPVTTGTTSVTVTAIGDNRAGVEGIDGATVTNIPGSEFVEFTTLKLNAKVGSYKLRFTSTNGSLPITGKTIDLTGTITVTYGDATKIRVATPAASARAGMGFGTQPIVEVRDANDNVVADSTIEISASITNQGYNTIGIVTKNASAGIANFDGTGFGITGLAATGLTLNFSAQLASGSAVNDTQTIDLTAGVAAAITMNQQPSTVQTGENMSPAPSVTVRDAWTNPVLTDSSTRVKASLYRGTNLAGQQYVSGQANTKTASAGTVTFSGLQVVAPSKAGYSYRLQMVDANANVVGEEIESSSFEITPGAPNSIVILQQPDTVQGSTRTKSGELLKQQPSVQLLDLDGNIATQIDSGSVTISVNGTGGSLSGQTTANLTDGVATFTGVKLSGKSARVDANGNSIAATGYTFTFTYSAISRTTTTERTVDHNVAHHLTLVRNAGTARAGQSFSGVNAPIVEIRDADENLVNTGEQSSWTVLANGRIDSGSGNVTVTSNYVSATDGVATINLAIGGSTSNTYALEYTLDENNAVVAASQTGITISYGVADSLRWVTQPSTLVSEGVRNKTGDVLAVQPVLEFIDAYGNRVANASSYSVTASIGGAQFDIRDRLENVTEQSVNGLVTYDELKLIGRPDHAYTLRFDWVGHTGKDKSSANDVIVTHADAHHLTITRQPLSELVAGVKTQTGAPLNQQPIIEVRDFDDNIVTTHTGYAATPITATIATGGGSTTAMDGGQANVNTVSIVNGVATFTNLKVVATPNTPQTLVFSAPLGVDGASLTTLEIDTAAFELTHANAAKLAVITQPCTGSLNGSGVCQAGPTGGALTIQPSVQVQDRFGNPVTDFVGSVTAGLVVPAGAPAGASLTETSLNLTPLTLQLNNTSDVTFAGLVLTGKPGINYRLSFSSDSLTSVNSAQISLTNAVASQIRVTGQPTGGKTGALLAAQPSVQILDQYGNVATTDSSTQITVTASGGELTGTTTITVANGEATYSNLAFVGVPGDPYTLTFTSGSLTSATSSSFQVTHADARSLVWLSQPAQTIKTGDRIEPRLKLVDIKGNTATTAVPNSISANISGSDGSLVNATGSIAAGIVTFADLQLVGIPGTSYSITITVVMPAGSITSEASRSITPTHAVPAQFEIDDSAVGGLSGSVEPTDPSLTTVPKLIIRDRFGNAATSDNSTSVSVSIAGGSGGTVSGSTTVTAVNGVATFTGLVFAGVPGTQYTFSFAATAANGATFTITDSTVFTVSKRSDISISYVNQAYVADAKVLPATTTDSTTGVLSYTITEAAAIGVICDIDAATGEITIKGAGLCPVRVDVAATTYYRTHYAVTTFEIARAQQSALNITSTDEVFYMQDVLMNTPLLQPTATGGSTAATVRFWATGDCRLISGKLITGNAGTDCSILATKAGDANYLSVSSVPMDIIVKKVEQAPLSIANTLTASVGDVELFTTGGSGEGAISYTVDTAGTANCSIVEGTKLRAAANGTCKIFATKAASTNFNLKVTALKTFTFNKLAQSIAFTSTIPQSPVRGVSYTPVAVASSGGVVTYAITTGNGTACEFDPIAAAATPAVAKINFLAVGTCTVTATQSGGSTYVSASATQTIEVGQLNQTITFAALAEKTFGSPDFLVTASSNSGLNVGFTVGTATTNNACAVSASGLVTLQHEGLCEIAANQPGNAIYAAAPTVRQSFYVRADLAGKPKITSISVANQSFTATFTAPSYLGGAEAMKYRLMLTQTDNGDEYANSNCSAVPSSGTTLTCTVVGIPNNVAYNAEVAAITIAGIGNYSDAVGPLTPSANPMGVTQLTASQTSTTNLAVVWEEPVVLDATLKTYEVYVAPLGSATFPTEPAAVTTQLSTDITIASSPMASVSVSGATFGGGFRTASVATFMHRAVTTPVYSSTGYQVKVVTVTENYNPNTSITSDYQTIGQQIGLNAPSSPRSLTLTPTGSGLFISWATPLSDGGSPIASYDVYANGELVLGCEAVTGTSCDALTNLTPYTDYLITVVARSEADLTSIEASATHDVAPAPAPPAPPAPPVVEPTPTPSPTGSTSPTPRPTTSPTSRPTTRPTPAPTGSQGSSATPTPSESGTPTSEPTAAPTAPPTSGPTAGPEPVSPLLPVLPNIDPGAPVPNPAIGATGDDDAPPAPFDPTGSPEAVEAAVDTAVTGAVIASALAAAIAAAAAAAGAAAAAAAAGAAAAGAYRKPEEFGDAENSNDNDGEGEGTADELEVAHDTITIEHESWGDKLALFASPFITFLDRRSHNAAERIANISPFVSKVINDGAYLRAMLGTLSLLAPIAAAVIAIAAVTDNSAEIAAGDYSKIITPAWTFLLAIAALGAFDAAAGFVGAMVFIIGSVATIGHVPDASEIRTMMGIMLVAVGPALLTTGFRSIRKHAALDINAWWERIADFVIAPFMAGWSISAIVSGLPALAGLTLDVANHVQDFSLAIAAAIFIRVALEELAAAGFPARLNKINPDEIPHPSILQRSIVLVIKYGIWVFIGGALIGPSWQVVVGSALFVFPTVVGWFSDKFPNSPRLWRILPTGIPGLAFTLIVASVTAATIGAALGDDPMLGKWSFLILPMPMLVITALGWFGRHGVIDANGNEEERPGKRNKWVYRIGGIVVMVLTLKLAGII